MTARQQKICGTVLIILPIMAVSGSILARDGIKLFLANFLALLAMIALATSAAVGMWLLTNGKP